MQFVQVNNNGGAVNNTFGGLALIRSAGEVVTLRTSDGDVVIKVERIRGDKKSVVLRVIAPDEVEITRD